MSEGPTDKVLLNIAALVSGVVGAPCEVVVLEGGVRPCVRAEVRGRVDAYHRFEVECLRPLDVMVTVVEVSDEDEESDDHGG